MTRGKSKQEEIDPLAGHQIAYTTGTGSYTAGGCEERSYMIPALFISRREGGSNTKIPSREE